jgi:serine/threonine protein kinase
LTRLTKVLYLKTRDVWKLSDFGRDLTAESERLNTTVARSRSNAVYLAPEIIDGKDAYEKGTDIWAVGCIAYEVACGKPAFVEEWEVMKIGRGGVEFNVEGVDAQVRSLVRQTLRPHAWERPGAGQLHEVVVRSYEDASRGLGGALETPADLEDQLRKYNPVYNLGVIEAPEEVRAGRGKKVKRQKSKRCQIL